MKYIPLYALALLLASSCSQHNHHHHHDDEDEHHTEASHHDGAEEHEHGHKHSAEAILLEPAKAKAAGVEVERVEYTTFHDVIVVSGQVGEASCDESAIVATVPGIVTHTRHISEGSAVQKGSVLYLISSANLQDGDQMQHRLIALQQAESEWQRAQALHRDRLITDKEYNAIHATYESARLAYDAVADKRSERGVSITAPETGFVKECFVMDGDYVEVGQRLMTITRNQHLYLRAEVPMRYYNQLERIQTARFRTALSPELYDVEEMDGHLLASGKSISKTYSYIPLTFEFDNRGGIVPGTYAEVFLIAGERPDVLSVPTAAITEAQGLYFVYVQEDAHSYVPREVTLGASDGKRVEITHGLKDGERVVTAGAMSVKLAGASKAVPGHTHNH